PTRRSSDLLRDHRGVTRRERTGVRARCSRSLGSHAERCGVDAGAPRASLGKPFPAGPRSIITAAEDPVRTRTHTLDTLPTHRTPLVERAAVRGPAPSRRGTAHYQQATVRESRCRERHADARRPAIADERGTRPAGASRGPRGP